jgi:hypothetical protein
MTEKEKVAEKASTSVTTGTKAEDAKAAEISVKEVEDRLAFANAARCDIASSST